VFKTSTGRRIAPVPIESTLTSHPLVEAAAVLGAGRKFLIAIVCIEYPGESAFAEQAALLQQELPGRLQSLAAYRRPAGLVISGTPFSAERGELTTNLKLRRHQIYKHYTNACNELFDQLDKSDKRLFKYFRHGNNNLILCSL
jgi:long-chain acyl-CoA synthetase